MKELVEKAVKDQEEMLSLGLREPMAYAVRYCISILKDILKRYEYLRNDEEAISKVKELPPAYPKKGKQMKTDCYFYSEEKDMGANIPSCDYYLKLGFCPCDDCKKYIKTSEVYYLAKKKVDGKCEIEEAINDFKRRNAASE